MKPSILIILLLSNLFSNVLDNWSQRIRQDFELNRESSTLQLNSSLNEEELIQLIQSLMDTHLIPGLSISIVKDDNIVWEKHLGYANIEEQIPVNENTMFILSSVSKTIAATALLQLYELGLFELDDNINSYLPFPVNHPDYLNTPITFKMLLAHTSGIKDQWSVMTYYDGDSNLELGYYLEEYLTPNGEFYSANGCYTNSEPGTNYRYSNNGAALIGLLVEEISNQPFNEYCNQHIFEPLLMDNAFWFLSEIENLNQVALPYELSGNSGNTCYDIGCGVYDESNPCFCDSECVYYNDCCSDYDEVCGENGTGSNEVLLTPQNHYGYSDYPSGQLRTTSNNLAKFMSAYINNGIYNNVRILNAETIELIKMISYPNVDSQQGLIWYYKNQNGRILFGHNGGDIGSSTEMFISFSNNIGVILLSNSSNYNAIIQIENAVFDFAEQIDSSIIGDINSDHEVNILDVISLVNIILGQQDENNSSDINSDGNIDVLDVVQIVNIILT